MSNWYATREGLRRRLNLDATDDLMLTAIIEAVSRQIDAWCGRHFYSLVATRTLTAACADRLLVPDLLAVTTLATDTSGDLTYATTWNPTEYTLLPSDALLQSPPHPYWEVRVAPGGSQSFGTSLHGVQITGSWGYSEVLIPSAATSDDPVDASQTVIRVSPQIPFEVGMTMLMEAEQVFVTDLSGNDLTVQRGVNGTTAAAHPAGLTVAVSTYPVIGEACLLQAGHLYQSTQTPGGIIGGTDFGPVRLAAFQPLVRVLLQPFRLPGLASYAD